MRGLPIAVPTRKSELLKTGQTTSYGSGSGLDDGSYRKGRAKSYTRLSTAQYSGTTNIVLNGKTDAHSNNCVLDNNTKLMWSMTVSGSVGPTSDGKLPWTTTGSGLTAEGIFAYVQAANAANLGGHNDWRIPNIFELFSLTDHEAPSSVPDATAFVGFPANIVLWSSTTRSNNTINAMFVNFLQGLVGTDAKTATYAVLLVRAGNP